MSSIEYINRTITLIQHRQIPEAGLCVYPKMEGGQNSQVSAAHGHANHVPKLQTQLLLYKPRHSYEIYHRGEVPTLSLGELLVEILAIGLNPIDWKSA